MHTCKKRTNTMAHHKYSRCQVAPALEKYEQRGLQVQDHSVYRCSISISATIPLLVYTFLMHSVVNNMVPLLLAWHSWTLF